MEPAQIFQLTSQKYGPVEVYTEQTLGVGSYGKVCKAKCGQLPCAAKLLHDTLFSPTDPGVVQLAMRFRRECQLLSDIKHPHVVQYLDTLTVRGRSVLLMELMDQSLTKHLEGAATPLECHTQVDICHDVILALAYLHSEDIIHRDLSSNNILLVAGRRAKVTDFGMSKLVEANPQATPLTLVPGTQVYMPPEALIVPPRYSNKLDCFSFGVLAIQIATRKFPKPGEGTRFVDDPNYPTGRVMEVVPERERRREHIELVEPDNPLLGVALECIRDRDTERPLSSKLCGTVESIKHTRVYTESVKRAGSSGGVTRGGRGGGGGGGATEHQLRSALERAERRLEESRERERQLSADYKVVEEELNVRLVQAEEAEQEIRQLRQRLSQQEQEIRRCNSMLRRKEQDMGICQESLSASKGEVMRLNNTLSSCQRELLQLKITMKDKEEGFQRERGEQERALKHNRGKVKHLQKRLSEQEVLLAEVMDQNRTSPTVQPERVLAPSPVGEFYPPPQAQHQPVLKPAEIQVRAPSPIGEYYQFQHQPVFKPEADIYGVQLGYHHRPRSPPQQLQHQPVFNPHADGVPPPNHHRPRSPSLPVIRQEVPRNSEGRRAPQDMTAYCGQATHSPMAARPPSTPGHTRKAYFTQNRLVYVYDEVRNDWAELPRCEQKNFGVAFINDKLTALGGLDWNDRHTNVVMSFTGQKWEELLPPMPTAREWPAVVTTPSHLVVACGMYVADDPNRTHTGYETVELMPLDTLQWSVACSLPVKVCYPQLKHTTGQLVLSNTETNQIYKCSLDKLIRIRQAQPDEPVWSLGASVPTKEGASLVTVGRTLLAVGGIEENQQASRKIFSYQPAEDRWVEAGAELLHARSWTMTVSCPGEVILVVGGYENGWKQTDIMEKIRLP